MRTFCSYILVAFFSGIFILFSPPPLQAGQGEDLFAQAVSRYQSGDYPSAIALNERLLNDMKVESPAVYFNLGNSYFKDGKLGRALLNYLRAERLSPRDGDIRANLGFARQAVEQVEPDKEVPSGRHWFSIFSTLSSIEFKWLALLSIILAGTVCLWGLYAQLPMKRVLLITGFFSAVSCYICLGAVWRSSDSSGRAVVLSRTEALFEPSAQATAYFKVPEGAEVRIQRHKDGWIKIQRADGRSGWVPENTAGAI